MSHTYTWIITREIEVEVSYDAWPASRGARDSLGGKAGAGPPLEPDDPGGIEITGARDDSGREWELTDEEEREIEEAIAQENA